MPITAATAAWLVPAIVGGATVAQGVHATKSANRTNMRALDASEHSDTRAADLAKADAERQERIDTARLQAEKDNLALQLVEAKAAREAQLAETKADRESRLQRDRERWADYLRINEPVWRQGQGMLNTLSGIMGYGGGWQGMPSGASMPPSGSNTVPGTRAPAAASFLPRVGAGDLVDPNGNPISLPRDAGPRPDFERTIQTARRPSLVATPAPKAFTLADLMQLASMGGGATAQSRIPSYGGSMA